MTVAELIEVLRKLPPDLAVNRRWDEACAPFDPESGMSVRDRCLDDPAPHLEI
jgi:hypothetical protein